jgi:hypothetical protein
MIQRRQSLYLLIVFVLTVLLFTGPLAFISLEEGGIYFKHHGAFDMQGEKLNVSSWPVTVMIAISALLSFLTIFSYMNRSRQIRLTIFLMIFNLGMIGMAYYYVHHIMHNFGGIQFLFKWRIVLPPIMLVLQFLAFKGIQKDELLIKAADRIR